MSKLDILNNIVSSHTGKKVKCRNGKVYIDLCTAKSILLIYNAIKNPTTK